MSTKADDQVKSNLIKSIVLHLQIFQPHIPGLSVWRREKDNNKDIVQVEKRDCISSAINTSATGHSLILSRLHLSAGKW